MRSPLIEQAARTAIRRAYCVDSIVAALALLLGLVGLLFASMPASAAEPIQPGAVCTVPDAWYSAPYDKPQATAPEAVRVVLLAPMPTTTEPGAWVQPVAGPYSGLQFHIKAERLKECKA